MRHQIALAELTALVVEPSALQFRLISTSLTQAGVGRVEHAHSGAAAMSRLKAGGIGLAVSAFHLPDITGAGLVGAMRGDPATADTPFILVSSESRPQLLDPVRQSGVSSILPKPFSQAQMDAALRATLDFLNSDDALEASGFDLEGLRVLVVDDSPMARKFIRQVLSNLGVRMFIEAENGRQAAELISDTPVDLVVTDYNMPEMDGQALIEFIRTQSWQKTVPVLMVTSETNEGRLAAVQDLGVVGMCDKPFEPATVRSLLARLLAEG
jgi:two-component system, chemotaxis family, chemotaxis protein CheY